MPAQALATTAPLPAGTLPLPGQVVRVRTRLYLVEDVAELAADAGAGDLRVSLSCLDDDAQGDQLDVLWQKELDAEVQGDANWQAIASRGFDAPRQFSAFLHTVRWNGVTSTNAKLMQSPYRAGIEIKHFQLEPLRKALALPRVNLFIADDVGLGKTIEAGLILRELLIRQKVRRVVVVCPPSVEWQWRDELDQRFGLSFEVYDRAFVMQRRKDRGFATNPWTTHSRFIISHSRLRDEEYAGLLRDWLGDFGAQTLLILDEAHHAAPASGQRYAIDSQLTKTIRDLAPRFEHRLFLSATPHNGHSNSFSALLELLDPQRFVRGLKPTAADVASVMVRRLKADLREIGEDFPQRQIIQLDIAGLPEDAPELRLSGLLEAYAAVRELRVAECSKAVQNASKLVVTQLQKRLLSSIEAFAGTLQVHRATLARQADKPTQTAGRLGPLSRLRDQGEPDGQRDAELADDERQLELDGELAAATLAVERAAADSAELRQRERAILDEMTEVAQAHRHAADPRVKLLVEWIGRHQCSGVATGDRQGAPWTATRLLIFTEFADTLRWLEQQLRSAIARTDRADDRIALYQGGSATETREAIKRAFNADPSREPLRILLCTDAAREGINLQNHCADLFHFDLPWNPSRIEQRNGRIDRTLQTAKEVRCHYFVFQQRPEDRVLQVLVRKVENIRSEHVTLAPLLDARIGQRMQFGIRRQQAGVLVAQLESIERDTATEQRALIEEELEASRERREGLQRQIEQLRKLNEQSQAWLGFDAGQFRDALSCALELQGAGRLEPTASQVPGAAERFAFPQLDRLPGADPSWAASLDSLRPPRRPEQKPWQWRQQTEARPVVFRDVGRLDSDTVHLHLEHRLVKRLLGRFVAQGFVHDQLSRACVLVTPEAQPKVVLLGRLSLFGPGAARLHDEVLAVTARWQPPGRRQGLRAYAADQKAEGETIAQLERDFAEQAGRQVADATREMLRQSAPADVAELMVELQQRATEVAADATAKLHQRGAREAQEMVRLLQNQRERIHKEQARHGAAQGLLDLWDADERRQLDADRLAWQRRLTAIDSELLGEPLRIEESFDVKLWRIEPLGLVYLWPQAG